MEQRQRIFAELGQNSGYALEMYELYQKDPTLVGETWSNYFNRLNNETPAVKPVDPAKTVAAGGFVNGVAAQSVEVVSREFLTLQEKVDRLIEAYRTRGHLIAQINPLRNSSLPLPYAEDLEIEGYGFSDTDLSSLVRCNGLTGRETMTLREVIQLLKVAYTGTIGYEYTHIHIKEEREWLQSRIEERARLRAHKTKDGATTIMKKLVEAEIFEEELHKRYVGQKRFSLQGAETLIPVIDCALRTACKLGAEEGVIGMAHRGRLNVLANTLQKPLKSIFSEFEDQHVHTYMGSGDVKYHLGFSTVMSDDEGRTMKLSMAPNPSHLEFVNPVVQGITRAKQDFNYKEDRAKVIPILLHGDAAFVGQGVVWETINMSLVPGYLTGGTFHVVINNQVGFTTDADEGRSSPYVTDIAKAATAPVIHVNGEDVESSCFASELLMEYRQKFGKDVVLDMYSYRKYGHNEGDDPSFTQPLIYAEIKDKNNISSVYADDLVKRGILTNEEVEGLRSAYAEEFDRAHNGRIPLGSLEVCATHGKLGLPVEFTGVNKKVLARVADTLVNFKDGFSVHPKLHQILQKRVDSIEKGEGIDWGFAEGLAYGSLLLDGVSIRFTGQDVRRGTFSHRHLGLTDFKTAERYTPFDQLRGAKDTRFYLYNSTLSETSVLGFEFGYSSIANNCLVLWEAQFGDFSNGAQVIIDQFIASSEAKWQQLSGIVLLLPHGYEGQGPEHSSARLERFLQLCAENNMIVAVPSSAAQYFHLLRRQALFAIKRPLVVMNPKSLLRLGDATSTVSELEEGRFNTIIVDSPKGGKARSAVLLSGKVYYDVRNYLKKEGITDTALIRVEQLYPFPGAEIRSAISELGAKNIIWLQEEPKNNGGWSFVHPRMIELVGVSPKYVGRPESSSVATGSLKRHAFETESFLLDLNKLLKS